MRFNIKFQIFLIRHRHLLNLIIPFMFYLSFIGFDPIWITLCSGEQDPCLEATMKSLKDLEIQNESQGWLSKKANNIALDGKNGQVGTGVVEREGKVYVVQTAEVRDKNGEVLRRISDCVRGDKKK